MRGFIAICSIVALFWLAGSFLKGLLLLIATLTIPPILGMLLERLNSGKT
jgi:hypothetical protein